MKKLLLIVTLLTLAFGQLHAIPAYPYPIKFTQPDGNEVTIRVHGDEFYNYYTTEDGYTVVQNNAGYYMYGMKENGMVVASNIVARNIEQRSVAEKAWLNVIGKVIINQPEAKIARQSRLKRDDNMKSNAKMIDYSKFKGLIILVEFEDCKFSRSDVKDFYQKMINQRNYTGYNNEDGTTNQYGAFKGSVRDYFYDNSMHKFDPTFTVVGPVKVSQSVNSAQGTNNIDPIIVSAIKEASKLTNFPDFDLDHDGSVDMTYFIFAGVGANTGEAPNHVWPHASYFYYYTGGYPIGGSKIYRYACSCEYYSKKYDILDGIGTMCHEFTHVLGLPDLYDTDYEGSGGETPTPDKWDLMASGGYNNYGRTPVGYSAYDRYATGFMNVKVIDQEGTYTLKPIHEYNEAYMLKTPVNKETFLLENRQQKEWDLYCEGHGMLVSRMDSTNSNAWVRNDVNINPKHPYFELRRAWGGNTTSAGDPFPGERGIPMITNNTYPSLKTWSGKENQFNIVDIKESEDGNITFSVKKNVSTLVEDFENIIATGGTNNVQGKFTTWSFHKNASVATYSNLEGKKAVAMKMPSSITSGKVNYATSTISVKVNNPKSVEAQFTLQYSTDGKNWTKATASTGKAENKAAPGKHELFWNVKSTGADMYYRLVLNGGVSINSTVYVDNFTIYEAGGPMKGDVNGDGQVNVSDVTELINMVLGASSVNVTTGDLNGDGKVTENDVTELINIILTNG